MALAPVAVTMGLRNQRRLTMGAIVLGVVSVAAAAAFLLLPSSHSGAGSARPVERVHPPTFVTDKIVYGMKKVEVIQRIGHPAKTVGPCWQYDENEKIRNGEDFLDAERVCFLSGVYSYDYSEIDGKWNYPTDSINLPHPIG